MEADRVEAEAEDEFFFLWKGMNLREPAEEWWGGSGGSAAARRKDGGDEGEAEGGG